MLKVIVPPDILKLMEGKVINGFPVLKQDGDDGFSWMKELVVEIVGTFFLVTMVWMTAVHKKAPEDVHGMAIGGSVGFMLLAAPKNSAIALNPARALCPMLIDLTNPEFKWVWIW